ncbi:MAG: hypothetical protein ACQKBT_09085, partial [Puniceicoccales bacterium]
MKSPPRLLSFLIVLISLCLEGFAQNQGKPISYQIPAEGPLPQTYLVTLAIVEKDNPDWIISTFAAGVVRTVTEENQGKFTEYWDGLDENFMPVPPGDYGVKGIYSLAHKWPVDGKWYAITPRYSVGFSPWFPSPDLPEHWKIPLPFGGNPINAPFRDVDVAENGISLFYYRYLENNRNLPMFDLNKPVDYQQFIRSFPSGGAAGGLCAATDGVDAWAYAVEGGPRFIYRADGKPFGKGGGANRRNVFVTEGQVYSMAAWRDPATDQPYVYVPQTNKWVVEKRPGSKHDHYRLSDTEFINKIYILDGNDGKVLDEISIERPHGIIVRNGYMYVLHTDGKTWTISRMPLQAGLPSGDWEELFQTDDALTPNDLEVDQSGRIYLSDLTTNKVYQFDAKGELLRTYGRLGVQEPGTYDPLTFMKPGKLATWRDRSGKDRLIVAEWAGPNRVSEWSADSGELLREMPSYQTMCNVGYAWDPDDPTMIYVPTHEDWLTRFKVDYENHTFAIDAVWPGVGSNHKRGFAKAVAVRANGSLFLASELLGEIYRLSDDGKQWILSAGLLTDGVGRNAKDYFWNDSNGNGIVDDAEKRPTEFPVSVHTYHGQKWLEDLSFLAINQRGISVYQTSPSSFDQHGNPVFDRWEKLLTDPVFVARREGTADALHGGNELADSFDSNWFMADGSPGGDYYVHARGGPQFTPNYGTQHKISRYVQDEQGDYQIKWRVGRTRLSRRGDAAGEIQGGMRLFKPINGLLTLIDQSRSGVMLYTEDGLYVDTLFSPGSNREEQGVYRQGGEFFSGSVYTNPSNGKIYYAGGKYTPLLFEFEHWSLNENPVRRLTQLPRSITINTSEIADPPEIAISLRGEIGSSSTGRFAPALGGAALDGSMEGWHAAT